MVESLKQRNDILRSFLSVTGFVNVGEQLKKYIYVYIYTLTYIYIHTYWRQGDRWKGCCCSLAEKAFTVA